MSQDPQRPEIAYPTRWSFKVIGTDSDAVAEAVRECLAQLLGPRQGERDVKLEPSRASAQGKYCSWALHLLVESRQERDDLFGRLAAHDDVRVVL